jgi:hypothetical protein
VISDEYPALLRRDRWFEEDRDLYRSAVKNPQAIDFESETAALK